jgi:hypothetical protein
MKKTSTQRSTLTARETNHKMLDQIDDAYMDTVRWLLQGFVAKTLNEEHGKGKQK